MVINLFAMGSIIATKAGWVLYISLASSIPVRPVERDEVATGGGGGAATIGLKPFAPNKDVDFSSIGASTLRGGRKTATLSF